jgi:hypothetical protein
VDADTDADSDTDADADSEIKKIQDGTNPAVDELGEWEVDGSLRSDDLFHPVVPENGVTCTSISDPLYYSYGDYKLTPRDAGDIAE